MAARRILNGTPGTVWKNTTGKVRWQALVNWRNSCGRCIANDHAISTSKWPFPLHQRCMCAQLPIYPGKEGLPFVDFREEIDRLPPHRRADVIGKAALALVDNHMLRWPDVVTKDRIKPLHELVAKHRLTVEKMTAAGVDRRTAQRAFDRAHGHDAEALAEAHRRAQEEAIAAKAEAQRQAKEAARKRLEEREAKVKARPRKAEVTPAEAGSAKVLADYLRKGNVKISKIEEVVAGRFGTINAEAEARRLRAAEAKKVAREGPAPTPRTREEMRARARQVVEAAGLKFNPNGAAMIKKGFGEHAGKQVTAAYGFGTGTVHLNEEHPAWEDADAMRAFLERRGKFAGPFPEDPKRPWFSAREDPDHVIVHELGHALHDRAAGMTAHKEFKDAKLSSKETTLIRDHVSMAAAVNPFEFVAETYSGMAAGKAYPPEVMALYDRFRGPRP